MGRVTRRYPVLRLRSGAVTRAPDTVAVEEPLEIRLNGESFQVTMRTPGHDIDLVHGLLHSEGIICESADVVLARYCEGAGPDGLNTYNVVDVSLRDGLAPTAGLARNVLTTSACGICGTASVDQVRQRSRYAPDPDFRVVPDVVLAGPQRLRAEQRTFDKTGGLHAAGLMTADGQMLCVREDVGRHNAVDKVIGWALRAGRLPLAHTLLCVSARASFELTQKAVLAGIPLLAAVSAPSSLAVELAEESGLTLVGFIRNDGMNIYSHPDRVGLHESREPVGTASPTC
ncbi:MAG TPA: formate dehydrogenase accessory sulfurtransferase FdhD [Propionibacteriaceae bacterium]|nr:formate dehydrogenase accessory sulfurtransferase FdhD [Propionibacteriaceae bacterium]